MQIKGSDTLINMFQKLSEAYMQKNPGKAISVTGGGSGTGIAAMINKAVRYCRFLARDQEQGNRPGQGPTGSTQAGHSWPSTASV